MASGLPYLKNHETQTNKQTKEIAKKIVTLNYDNHVRLEKITNAKLNQCHN